MTTRFTPGVLLELQVPPGRAAYGLMLDTRPYMAFFDDKSVDFKGDKGLVAAPLFVVAVHKSAYSTGRWGEDLSRIDRSLLPAIPLFFRQDVLSPLNCVLVDSLGNVREVKPEECVGVERSAVWSAEHVEKRIEDHYLGRSNAFVESMKVKL